LARQQGNILKLIGKKKMADETPGADKKAVYNKYLVAE
jgi:hypothetical protein